MLPSCMIDAINTFIRSTLQSEDATQNPAKVDNGAPDQAVVPADRLRQPFVVWPNPALGDNDGAIDPRLILEPEDIVRPPDLVAGGPGLSGMIVSIVSPYRSHTGCTVPT